MLENIEDLAASFGASPELLLLVGVAIGALVFVMGVSSVLAGPGQDVRRMRGTRQSSGHDQGSQGADLIRSYERRPEGFLKAFVPSSEQERSKIAKSLRQAGFHRRNAVRDFYAIRTFLSIVLPILFIAYLFFPTNFDMPFGFGSGGTQIGTIGMFQILTVLVVVGFYGPSVWLRSRIRKRRQEITFGFPNALDLLQVAIEAGLGFDTAMTRVANELAKVSPAISEEFLMLQLEIQAGKDRDRAFLDMAERAGVDEVASFSNVIMQATQFGTSVSDALSTYANEMRVNRELKAQERANRLPVQMSGVMAGFMMPVLLMLILSPVLIRWMRVMGEGG